MAQENNTSSYTVSVVIPTCNRPELLTQALKSVFAQSVPIHEVFVVDDHSDIDSASVVAPFGEKVHFERLVQKSGANVARNRGIERSTGAFIAFLDDDDVWAPEKTAQQVEAMTKGGYEACLCTSQEVGGAPRPPKGWSEVRQEHLKYRTPCGTSGLIATREAVEADLFDPKLPRGQDWDLFVRLAQRQPLAFVDRALYFRQTDHDRITTQSLKKPPQELIERAAVVAKHRQWLGEDAYRQRMAANLLSFISQRRHKSRYIAAAIRHAGPRATARYLFRTLRKRLFSSAYRSFAAGQNE